MNVGNFTQLHYEWKLEHIDNHGDIQHVEVAEKLADFTMDDCAPCASAVSVDVCLVKHLVDANDELLGCTTARANSQGKLEFDDCSACVPKSKQNEYCKFMREGMRNIYAQLQLVLLCTQITNAVDALNDAEHDFFIADNNPAASSDDLASCWGAYLSAERELLKLARQFSKQT